MATQEGKEEDFSFSTTGEPPPRFIESPRLWGRTTRTQIHHVEEDEEDEEEDEDEDSSVSHNTIECVETQRRSISDCARDDRDNEEEKMDTLWEDFNEELFSRNSSNSYFLSSSSSSSSMKKKNDHSSHGKVMNFGCAHFMKLAKPNKRVSFVVFLKVLIKKVIMVQNSHHRSLKKRSR